MGKKIFVTPLDWGLGHVSRCIPLIHEIKNAGHEVFLAASPSSTTILKQEFPNEECFSLPENRLQYWYPFPAWWSILFQSYLFLKNIPLEKETMESLQKKINADIVISDNRYGCYVEGKKNIFITHQVYLPVRYLKKTIQKKLIHHLRNFEEIWIPDFAENENNLSGSLSHGKQHALNLKYIHPLSRLTQPKIVEEKIYNYCFLISGPEKWRTHFEEEAVNFINKSNAKFALIRGTRNKLKTIISNNNCEVIDFADRYILEKIISVSEFVVCRSGYSTIMDLVQLQKPAFLYPTPGQPEQLYLSRYLSKFEMFLPIKRVQDITSEKKPKFIEGVFFESSRDELKKAIESL